MAGSSLSFVIAASGGALSFLSPCVLPLVPAYLSYVAGASLEELAAAEGPPPALARRTLAAAFAFVLGFSTVFIMLGASASAVSQLILPHLPVLAKVAGVIIVLFGLHMMGLLRIRFLNREARFNPAPGQAGLGQAYVLGLAFAFGWTPCIGPILAAILALAATQKSLDYGTLLLAVYALGLGIPFLLTAFAVDPFLRFLSRFRRHLRKAEIAAGGLLVATGVLIFTNSLGQIGLYLLQAFPRLAKIG
jgi:cytochrome c-type biogenesis protein